MHAIIGQVWVYIDKSYIYACYVGQVWVYIDKSYIYACYYRPSLGLH